MRRNSGTVPAERVRGPGASPAAAAGLSGAHRWRFACADPPLSVGALADPDHRLYVAGDWCAGNRVEGAFLSGLEAARLVG